MRIPDQIKLLEQVWAAALTLAESIDEDAVGELGIALKVLNQRLEAAEAGLQYDPRIR